MEKKEKIKVYKNIFLVNFMKEYDKMMLRSRKQMSETNMLMILLTISGGLQDAYSYFVRGEVFSNAQMETLCL